ncbi:hypothetical protein LNV47_22685 [Paucibacter sp. DJ4R-1]|nr:hypothetical protein [Paucibacter sp. DJ4R-1]
MANTLPSTHTAGDSAAWTLDAPATATPGAGWSAELVLIGAAARHTLTGAASGASAFSFAATAAASASWPPGTYTARLIATKGAERISAAAGQLSVLPDPAAVGTLAASLLSPAQQRLATLQAAYDAYLASGNFTTVEVRIGDRTRQFRSVPELLQALNAAKRDVEAETESTALAAGQSARRRFVVRM